jgi:hypothetical protein
MNDEIIEETISPSILELLAVFKTDLSSVSFPDVNLEVLDNLEQKVKSGAKELQDALNRADSMREALEAAQNELLSKAQRAMAYAKVFAEGNEALLEKLSGISLGKTRSPKKTAVDKIKVEKPQAETAPPEGQKTDDKKHSKVSKKSGEAAESPSA